MSSATTQLKPPLPPRNRRNIIEVSILGGYENADKRIPYLPERRLQNL